LHALKPGLRFVVCYDSTGMAHRSLPNKHVITATSGAMRFSQIGLFCKQSMKIRSELADDYNTLLTAGSIRGSGEQSGEQKLPNESLRTRFGTSCTHVTH